MKRGFLAALALAGLACTPASAQPTSTPLGVERLPDPAQEARAHAVFRQIRCVVCQNESIDDSEAPLAGDLRHIVRSQVAAGRSDADIRRFLVDRYGQFVLLKPSFDPANARAVAGALRPGAARLGRSPDRSARPPPGPCAVAG